MKKIISILLSAAILISALAIGFTVSASEEEMKIAYNAYDKDGNLLRSNACMKADIDGKKDGSTFRFLFAVPLETVKIEFFDYAE